ncbi:zf-TFIIB domain-containing protein [Pandoraea sp. NPDC087047]|uniref:TFIIB-type zinc ribbon-containing protein n=1 Tax=Pandoraea sp. NPDC087047 TaxID=3364390 RepID=UPI00380C176A
MKCPVCGTPDLLMTERQGVEIDYCPKCRGVWLDRGELDKLIERTEGGANESAQAMQWVRGDDDSRARRDDRDDYEHRNRHDGHDDRRRHDERPRKKKSLFEMFDFD